VFAAATAAFTLSACDLPAAADELSSRSPSPASSSAGAASSSAASAGTEPPRALDDGDGNRWIRVSPVTEWSAERTVEEEVDTPKDDIMAMTDEELAEQLRPIALIDGWQYEAADAPIQLARDMKSGAAERYDLGGEGNDAGRPVEREEAEAGPDVATSLAAGGVARLATAILGGSDNRELRRDNTSWPFATHIQFDVTCSATLIGPSTATSVAHCFMDKSGKWRSLATWAPGVDAQDANPTPFGSQLGCYVPVIRKGWQTKHSFTYDYAVVEFSNYYPGNCDLFPGNAAGWLGWWQWSADVITDGRPGYVYGYPAGKAPYPQIWGHGCKGSGCFDVDGSDEIEYFTIDTTGGQSGAGFYQKSSVGDRYVTGSHQGSWDPAVGPLRNRARRIDGSYADLIKNWSAK
jgi:V8-like Glu-specific endopeptidase